MKLDQQSGMEKIQKKKMVIMEKPTKITLGVEWGWAVVLKMSI